MQIIEERDEMEESDQNGILNTEIILSSRDTPRSHNGADPVLCVECQEVDLLFFDPSCLGCLDMLKNPKTTISQIFAIIRQWVPQTQQNIDLFIKEIFARGAHVNDKDGLTDMTLLHYAAKSGANGVGDIGTSLAVVKFLVDQGVDAQAKCSWTDMSALHYAVFFDIEPVVEFLLLSTNGDSIDDNCKEFDNGTALHIGCTNLCLSSVKTLIKFGANPHFLNKFGKPPIECIPRDDDADDCASSVSSTLRTILKTAMQDSLTNRTHNLTSSTLQALGLELNCKVVVSGNIGTLRFCGATDFASGQWAGIELDEPLGKNDGSVAGISYFTCTPKHGIFAPLTRIQKYDGSSVVPLSLNNTMDSSRSSSRASNEPDIQLDDRVIVDDTREGIVRYIGTTKFAAGTWVGVEADKACGKSDGTIAGVQYFQCKPKHGIFAPIQKICKLLTDNIESKKLDSSSEVIEQNQTKDSLQSENENESPNTTPEKKTKKKPIIKKKNSIDSTTQSPKKAIINANLSALSQPKKTVKVDKTFGAEIEFELKTGMSVYVNNEVGIVRYIGPVEFAEDTWLGIELRKPNGKNDGMVENKRYFTCKPQFGLMVKPGRATCRGINCAHLVDTKMRPVN